VALGESVLAPRRMLGQVARVEVLKPRLVKNPERTQGRSLKTRRYRHLVEAGPNAPKLIRLIRNPVSQDLGRMRSAKSTTRRSKTEWLRPNSAQMVREARQGRGIEARPRPTRVASGVPTRPQRTSIDAWLNEGEG
jgi:hypothetical protein